MTQDTNITTLKKWINEKIKSVSVAGLSGAAQSYFLSQFLSDLEKPCLILLPHKNEAERLSKELSFFLSGPGPLSASEAGRLHEFPSYDISPLMGLSPHMELVNKRIQALYALLSDKDPIIITSLEALFQKIMPKKALIKSLEYLEAGEDADREALINKLEAIGYRRSSLVEERGDYSVRGGVIDLFTPLHTLPIRLEFLGDIVESIRHFDPLSQRSKAPIKDVVILPANEILMERENTQRSRSMGRLPRHYEDGMNFPGQEAWLNHFYAQLDTIFDYLPENGLVASLNLGHAEAISQRAKQKWESDVEKFRKEAGGKGTPFPETDGIFVPFQEIESHLDKFQQMKFSELGLDDKDDTIKTLRIEGQFQFDDDLEVRLITKGRVSLSPLAEKISEWLSSSSKVVLVSRTEQQAERLKEILMNYNLPVARLSNSWTDIPEQAGLSICLGRLTKGFTWPELGLHVISEDEIFGPKRARSKVRRKTKDQTISWSSFSQLKAGDYLVHEDHGIGRYDGLIKMEIERKVNDFIVIEYADNARLYIPADRVSIIQKYAGADERSPRLDMLGGRSWNVAKQKAKKSVKRIAKQLVELYALRKYRKGYGFSLPDNYFREFEATFEHEETPDQIKAIENVLEDMTSEMPMDRLICGDVGFGKTEVAIRAAFKAVSDGKQVAFLVPTTVLAEQHYQTFTKRLDRYSIRIGILSRFKTKKEQSLILSELRSGKIDILIGTHRILQKDIKFNELGLLIIDEEQRFGVKQKETLKKFRALVDVLAITATPVPRTLEMSMMGVRDLSIIETPPEERLAIQTHLSQYDEALITRAIEFELERGGQAFFVHNRVQDIHHIADEIGRLVPKARLAIAHGQMKSKDLEKTMMRFLSKEIDVLICTAIIESGLDIPSANTIIINKVERLGLAQIYQLRGRVGRANEKAYAFLMLSPDTTLTRDAEKRLKALMDFSHLGAGLHLAMHDLEIRGGGNILGFAQSGHISAVGYELYLKLIERAIAELKGEEWYGDINPEINIEIPAFLPGDYVIDTDVRLNLYRRLSSLREASQLEEMKEEIRDRFGTPPQEVVNLLDIMFIRILLKKMGIIRLDAGPRSIVLSFSEHSPVNTESLVALINDDHSKYRFLSQAKIEISVCALPSIMDLQEIENAVQAFDLSLNKNGPQ